MKNLNVKSTVLDQQKLAQLYSTNAIVSNFVEELKRRNIDW